jgi:hypothetical protein
VKRHRCWHPSKRPPTLRDLDRMNSRSWPDSGCAIRGSVISARRGNGLPQRKRLRTSRYAVASDLVHESRSGFFRGFRAGDSAGRSRGFYRRRRTDRGCERRRYAATADLLQGWLENRSLARRIRPI